MSRNTCINSRNFCFQRYLDIKDTETCNWQNTWILFKRKRSLKQKRVESGIVGFWEAENEFTRNHSESYQIYPYINVVASRKLKVSSHRTTAAVTKLSHWYPCNSFWDEVFFTVTPCDQPQCNLLRSVRTWQQRCVFSVVMCETGNHATHLWWHKKLCWQHQKSVLLSASVKGP